jgi:hypothetical protein
MALPGFLELGHFLSTSHEANPALKGIRHLAVRFTGPPLSLEAIITTGTASELSALKMESLGFPDMKPHLLRVLAFL